MVAHFGKRCKCTDFRDISGKTDGWEPVWNNLAEVKFIPENKELSFQLFSIDDDVMYFNLNWDIDKQRVIPLQTIVDNLHKPLDVEVIFHDVENKKMYSVYLIHLTFEEILEPFYFNWENNTIKQLVVRFKYESIKFNFDKNV